jgi:glycosyltransferase involved in cell wall biosynthesis
MTPQSPPVSQILVITNNLQQASFRLRIDVLRNPLASRGVNLLVQVRPRGIFARRTLLKTAAHFDAVILQRKMLDPLDMKLLRQSARKIFFDVDDAVMLHSRPVGFIENWRTQRRFDATAKNADLVVAGNEYLAEKFRAKGAKVAILPTVVDPVHYQTKSHGQTDSPKLIWIGSASTLKYLQESLPILAEAAKQIPGLRLVTIADQTLAHSTLPLDHIAWSVESESAALCRGDIGIAPTPEDPWTLGKCGFKIVQFMAAGLPVIASPVGANRELVVPGETGYLASNSAQWVEAITKLSADPALRQKMGQAGRKRVEEHFSLAKAVNQWADWLRAES